MDFIVDRIFDEDLHFQDGFVIKNFTVKIEFEFDRIFNKYFKKAMTSTDVTKTITEEFNFDECEVVSKWMDLNSNSNEIFGEGCYMKKAFAFLIYYIEYSNFKKDIKKK